MGGAPSAMPEAYPYSAANISIAAVKHDLHTLLALMLSEKEITRLVQPSGTDENQAIISDDATRKHLIISAILRTAVTFRYLDDYKEYGKKARVFSKQDECGNLWTYIDSKKSGYKPLLPRDACNKIIHSNGFFFLPQENEGESTADYALLSFKIKIFNTHQATDNSSKVPRHRWEAELDLIKFTQACHRALSKFESHHSDVC